MPLIRQLERFDIWEKGEQSDSGVERSNVCFFAKRIFIEDSLPPLFLMCSLKVLGALQQPLDRIHGTLVFPKFGSVHLAIHVIYCTLVPEAQGRDVLRDDGLARDFVHEVERICSARWARVACMAPSSLQFVVVRYL
jgi:hypothetical protein